jgi:hypothetical protein
VGRLQNIEEALEIDKKIMDLVDFNIIVESKDQVFQKNLQSFILIYK